MRALLAIAVVLAAPAPPPDPAAAPARDYDRLGRAAYIVESLTALAQTPAEVRAKTADYIGYVERNRCRSSFERLRVECLIKSAARRCRGRGAARQRCLRVADLIITNRQGESRFISTSERYRIMKRYRRYREQLSRELGRRYAALVTEFRLGRDFACAADDRRCLAGRIDAFCRHHADSRALAWQYCVAAITWSIGTSGASEAAASPASGD